MPARAPGERGPDEPEEAVGQRQGPVPLARPLLPAAVRGTRWLVEDRCDGTLTRVLEGSVVVRDLGRRRNVVVRAGRSYLARARR